MARQTQALAVHADEKARCVGEKDQRHVERVAKDDEARRLAAGLRVECPTLEHRVAGDHAHRAPLDPRQPTYHELGEALDRKSTRLNSSNYCAARMPSSD